jgi:peroxiredoxin family protein
MTMQRPEISRRDLVRKSIVTVAAGMAGASLLANEAKAQLGPTIDPNTMSIIISKGSLDWAYSPFILATTAAAMGLEVTMFFTSHGLSLLMKDADQQISSSLLGDALLGLNAPPSNLIKSNSGLATIEELRELAIEADVRMIADQMWLDLSGLSANELAEGIEIGGSATYIEVATQSHINLHI